MLPVAVTSVVARLIYDPDPNEEVRRCCSVPAPDEIKEAAVGEVEWIEALSEDGWVSKDGCFFSEYFLLVGFGGSKAALPLLLSSAPPPLLLLSILLATLLLKSLVLIVPGLSLLLLLLKIEGTFMLGEGDEAETTIVGVIPDGMDGDVSLDRCCFWSFGGLLIGGFCCCCCMVGECCDCEDWFSTTWSMSLSIDAEA
jgi:hypothetical protein